METLHLSAAKQRGEKNMEREVITKCNIKQAKQINQEDVERVEIKNDPNQQVPPIWQIPKGGGKQQNKKSNKRYKKRSQDWWVINHKN